jgi:hypothetical protein
MPRNSRAALKHGWPNSASADEPPCLEKHSRKRDSPGDPRQTIRDEAGKHFMEAGMGRRNPDDPSRPTNRGQDRLSGRTASAGVAALSSSRLELSLRVGKSFASVRSDMPRRLEEKKLPSMKWNPEYLAAVERIVSRPMPDRIAATGLRPEKESISKTYVPAVTGLEMHASDLKGNPFLTWNAVMGATSYQVHSNPDPAGSCEWTELDHVPFPFLVLHPNLLPPRVWLRVRAVGNQGPGAWSAPVTWGKVAVVEEAIPLRFRRAA